jgi:hypothetical protein
LLAAALVALLGLSAAAAAQGPAQSAARGDDLPDAPSAQMQDAAASGDADAGGQKAGAPALRRCKDWGKNWGKAAGKDMPLQGPPPCMEENPISPIVTSVNVPPLTSKQKGLLAIRDFTDPFNFVTLAGYSGIAVAQNSHSAYGPGLKGWGRLTGYGVVEAAQGEFFVTYAIPSVMHEDPRYHRLPNGSVRVRVWHAVRHTYVSRHDDGRPMLNYATLLTYPISAELSNLYVPGVQTDGRSTAKRVAIGIAADPTGTIIAEFLPDVAKHIHIHVQFVQELVDRAMVGEPTTMTQ